MTDTMGYSGSIEFSDDLEILIDSLEQESAERELSRNERALIDVIDAVSLITSEEDALHEFWQSPVNHEQIINSFELVGASGLVDHLNSSQWCKSRTEDRSQYTETESSHIGEIEEQFFEELQDLPEILDTFVEEFLEEE